MGRVFWFGGLEREGIIIPINEMMMDLSNLFFLSSRCSGGEEKKGGFIPVWSFLSHMRHKNPNR